MENTLPSFHVMAKPTGARCNLNCDYCFFLKKEKLYPGSDFRMNDLIMEQYIRQTIKGQRIPNMTIAWQGGEPTMMGVDFFERAIEIARTYKPQEMTIEHTLQTNGVLIDDRWCEFFRKNNFLVGLSVDGPKRMHDFYRHDKNGKSVFKRVTRSARLLKKHKVEFNILCTINAVNSCHPLELYRFFRDELKTPYLQFIPIVERKNERGTQEGLQVTDRTVEPEQFGIFLIEIFDEWVRNDVGKMFVMFFDGVLASYLYGQSSLCILRPVCGDGVALEHNGDLYSCDHFVEEKHLLGNILTQDISRLVNSEKQRNFGKSKHTSLPDYCQKCKYMFTCYGECPKNRILNTPDGEPGLNWLCAGLKKFFEHTESHMKIMANLLRQGRTADQIMNKNFENFK